MSARELRQHICTVLALILVSIISCGGCCSNDVTPGYKLFTLREGISLFSFEYPESFFEPRVHAVVDGFRTTDVSVGRHFPGSQRLEILFYIMAEKRTEESQHASSSIDNLSYIPYEDFKLIGRSSLVLGEIPAKQVVYSWTQYQLDGTPVSIYVREVYFDTDMMIFRITLLADQDIAETARVEFDHLLETFKILE